jgi:hypothetical protein
MARPLSTALPALLPPTSLLLPLGRAGVAEVALGVVDGGGVVRAQLLLLQLVCPGHSLVTHG